MASIDPENYEWVKNRATCFNFSEKIVKLSNCDNDSKNELFNSSPILLVSKSFFIFVPSMIKVNISVEPFLENSANIIGSVHIAIYIKRHTICGSDCVNVWRVTNKVRADVYGWLNGSQVVVSCVNGWQLAKMKKSIPDMSLPWNL